MRIRGILTLTITYDDTSVEEVQDLLRDIAEHAANNGLMSGEGPAVVDSWHTDIQVKANP